MFYCAGAVCPLAFDKQFIRYFLYFVCNIIKYCCIYGGKNIEKWSNLTNLNTLLLHIFLFCYVFISSPSRQGFYLRC